MRSPLILIVAITLCLASARAVQARQQPCPDCRAQEAALAQAEAAAAATRARLAALDKQIAGKNTQLALAENQRAALQARISTGRGDDSSAATLRSYESVMAQIRSEIADLVKQRQPIQTQLDVDTQRVNDAQVALELCRRQPCPPPTGAGGGTDSGGTGVVPGTQDIPLPDPDAIPECEPCKPNAEAIKKWEKAIEEARARVRALEERRDELDTESLRLNAQMESVLERMAAGSTQALQREYVNLLNRMSQSADTRAEVRGSLDKESAGLKTLYEEGPSLEEALDKCNQSCPAPDPPRECEDGGPGPCSGLLQDKRVLGAVGGGVIATTLVILGGNGDTTPVMAPIQMPVATPNVPQMPSPPMPPSTPDPPMPPARTTADGRYRCIGVTIVSDPGGHNRTLRIGEQLTSDFDVREGSITIRHPEPFVDIVGAQFDIVTNRFFGTNFGRVAGSPNVGVSAEGTVDTTSGRIVFDYTMGTGGELPGGRPIIYGITLQKQ